MNLEEILKTEGDSDNSMLIYWEARTDEFVVEIECGFNGDVLASGNTIKEALDNFVTAYNKLNGDEDD